MPRLYFCLRLIAVALAVPVIVAYILIAVLLHPVIAIRKGTHVPLRIWMSVMDWARGIPVGYSFWVQYEAPAMLDEIAVHHDE